MRSAFKGTCLFLAAALLITSFGVSALAAETETSAAQTQQTETETQSIKITDALSRYKYSDYSAANSEIPAATGEVTVYGTDYVSASSDVHADTEYDSLLPADATAGAGKTVLTTEESTVSWTVHIPSDGLYVMNVLYYTNTGKDSDIERALAIDGKQPFTEAGSLVFPRVWKDTGEITQDIYGNDIRPEYAEVHGWYNIDSRDSSGQYNEPFRYYFTAGDHTLTLTSSREPVLINRIRLYTPSALISYDELKAQYASKGYTEGQSDAVRVQAENMDEKSTSSIYAEFERTSANMEPYSYDVQKLNQISGSKFTQPYQWIRWNFNVAQAGLYKIVVRFKQSDRDGAFCSRTLRVNGEVPCAEAEAIRFAYDSSWQTAALATAGGEVMEFYLHEGDNKIDLEVTLGDFADIIDRVDSVVYDLNDCYRQILMITGSSPDAYRDYQFSTLIPDVIEKLGKCGEELTSIRSDIQSLTNDTGSFTSSFGTLIFDVNSMYEKPSTIAKRLTNFKSNLGTLSTWMLNVTSQPVSFDWIQVTPVSGAIPKAEKGFLSGMWHQTRMFVASFYMDYNNVGTTEADADKTKEITVWITTGRDQLQILRRLIDNTLGSSTDIKVKLQLVAAGTLLPSVLAGIGPDVALGVGNSDPMNYAIRHAVIDLTQFSNYQDVASRFSPEASVPYTYKGKIYGLPETFTFPMLFYRKDILSELGISVPQTWDQVYDCVVKLNMNQMMFGFTADINTYGTLLYQQGGSFYNEDGSASALDQPVAIRTFQQWTEFYTAYGTLVDFDFANRFRTGEMPIGIANYSLYNQLSVFAPEIKGLWGFTTVPGTTQSDGTVDHTTLATGTACVILSSSDDYDAAWQFMDWWTQTDTQVKYGRELESIMGTAARYTTANEEALARLPWSTSDYKSIMSQWKHASALPEYPGSYILGRYVDFAFKAVVNEKLEPGEELLDYVRMINDELSRKRLEFEGTDTTNQ